MNEKTTQLTTGLLVGLVVLSVVSVGLAFPSGSVAAAPPPDHTDMVCYGFVCEYDAWCDIRSGGQEPCRACDNLCEHPVSHELFCVSPGWYCTTENCCQ